MNFPPVGPDIYNCALSILLHRRTWYSDELRYTKKEEIFIVPISKHVTRIIILLSSFAPLPPEKISLDKVVMVDLRMIKPKTR